MIDAIEDEDFDVCMKMIEERKESLMNELTLSLFDNSPVESTQKLFDMDDAREKVPNLANPKEAEAAQKHYVDALVKFYDALPKDDDEGVLSPIQKKMMTLAKNMSETWEAYVKVVGKEASEKANYKSPSLFKEFYAQTKKSTEDAEKALKDAKEAKEKAEKEAKEKADKAKDEKEKEPEGEKKDEKKDEKEKEPEELVVLEKEEKDPKDKEGDKKEDKGEEKKPVDPKSFGLDELTAFKEAGEAFEQAIHFSVSNLAKEPFTRSQQYYPYDDKKLGDDMGSEQSFDWKAYTEKAKEGKVDPAKLKKEYEEF